MTRYEQKKAIDTMMSSWINEKKEKIGEDYLFYVAGYFQSVLLNLAVNDERVAEQLKEHFAKGKI